MEKNTEYRASTFEDAQSTLQEASSLQGDQRWNSFKYDWSIDNAKKLNQMSLEDLTEHLKLLIGAKLSLEQLSKWFGEDVDEYTKSYNQKIDEINNSFDDFTFLARHPNEEAYREKHNGDLPQTKSIDYYRRKFSNWVIAIGIVLLMTARFRGLGVFMLIAGILFHFFAKHGYKFSQPVASFKNHLIVQKKQRILNADKKYCQDNDCSDETLKSKFKYEESLTPIYSSFTDQIRLDKNQTEYKLSHYSDIVQQNIQYFPPMETKDMRRLLKIYEALLNGVPTWEKALRYVGQNEKIDEMKNTLSDAIKNATSEITQEIKNAKNEVTSEIKKNSEMLDKVAEETHHQTNAINYWNTVQTSMQAYQMTMMNETRKNTEVIAAQYQK